MGNVCSTWFSEKQNEIEIDDENSLIDKQISISEITHQISKNKKTESISSSIKRESSNLEEQKSQMLDEKIKLASKANATSYQEIQNMQKQHRKQAEREKKICAFDKQDFYDNVQKIQKIPNSQDKAFLFKTLQLNSLFYDLSENEIMNIIDKMFYCEVLQGELIFEQNDQASSYFIIQYGEVEIIVNNEVKKNLNDGQGFGELALLYNAPRSASVKACRKCQLWGIDRSTFRNIIQELSVKQLEENEKFIKDVEFFKKLPKEKQNQILPVLNMLKFKAGENIVTQGDPAQSFYIIKKGTVRILKDGQELRKMISGEYFGELALFYKTTRSCTVQASDEVICLSLGQEMVEQIFGNQLQEITFKEQIRWSLEKDIYLSKLTKLQCEKIIGKIQIKHVQANEIIYEKGKIPDMITVVIEGKLIQKNSLQVCDEKQCFGIEYLVNKNWESLDESIIMQANGILAKITFLEFFKSVGGSSWEEIMKKNEKSHEAYLSQLSAMPQKQSNLLFEDLIFIKKIGAGSFGNVYLVSCENDPSAKYALKQISKAQILQDSLEKHLQQEKEVSEQCRCPFIMKFERSFKDDLNIYFLMEYVSGMELFDAIREIGLLTIKETKFYIGQIMFGLEYLHQRLIIYRDLKPENVMVDFKGNLKLIDMGTAKVLNGNIARTFTMLGTPHYLAPEVLTGKGYSFAVDLWSLGVLTYELISGYFPFGNEKDDPFEIYEEAIKKQLKFPNFLKDSKMRAFIKQLLNKVPESRLGGSFVSLKSHKLFEDMDWDSLFHKEMFPPYLPPQEKIVTKKDISEALTRKRKIRDEILATQTKKPKNESIKPIDPNWDAYF